MTAKAQEIVQYEVSDIERMAKAIAVSGLFGITKPEQAIALCLIAQAEGRHPASAAQDYHIIQGKPSKKADAMLRDFINAGGKVEWHTLDDTIADATFSHPGGGTVRIAWDMARAKKAQLNTAMWTKYPRQMLRSRVVSEGVRTIYPLATSGMYVPEEVAEFTPTVIEHTGPANRVRDGSDGQPKSSRQAKLSGDWNLTDEVKAIGTVAELEAWRIANQGRIDAMPKQWRDTFDEEIYTVKMGELQNAAESDDTLSEADSAVLLKTLIAVMAHWVDMDTLREWVRDKQTKTSIRSLTEADYGTFEKAFESRKDQLSANVE